MALDGDYRDHAAAVVERVARAVEPYLDSMLAPSVVRQVPLDALAALQPGDELGGGLSVHNPAETLRKLNLAIDEAERQAAEAMRERAARLMELKAAGRNMPSREYFLDLAAAIRALEVEK